MVKNTWRKNAKQPTAPLAESCMFLMTFLIYRLGQAVMTLNTDWNLEVDPKRSFSAPAGWTYGTEDDFRRAVENNDPDESWDSFIKPVKTWLNFHTSPWDETSLVYCYHTARAAAQQMTDHGKRIQRKYNDQLAQIKDLKGGDA